MTIAVLENFVARIITNLGLEGKLCALPYGANKKEGYENLPIVTIPALEASAGDILLHNVASESVLIDLLRKAKPEIILSSLASKDLKSAVTSRPDLLEQFKIEQLKEFIDYSPSSLLQVYEVIENIGLKLKAPAVSRDYVQKIQSQILAWADNFYDRTKKKKVTFLRSHKPLTVAGEWIADMIQVTSAVSQIAPGIPSKVIKWSDVVDFKPDVLMVAPEGLSADLAFATFKEFEKLPNWEEVPAVKRGEVYFSPGDELFYQPGVRMIDSMAFIVSCIAGLDSGYITKRDSFQRLRWLEMQRHKF